MVNKSQKITGLFTTVITDQHAVQLLSRPFLYFALITATPDRSDLPIPVFGSASTSRTVSFFVEVVEYLRYEAWTIKTLDFEYHWATRVPTRLFVLVGLVRLFSSCSLQSLPSSLSSFCASRQLRPLWIATLPQRVRLSKRTS